MGQLPIITQGEKMKPQLTIALQTILLVAVNSREVTKREVTDTLKSNEALDFKCVLRKCMKQFTNCAADRACRDAMGCVAQCQKPDAKPGCVFDCGYFNEEIPLVQFTDCLAINNCSETTAFGRCVGEDSDADQSITSISESNGVYWNVKGLNCGQDTIGEGFDNLACNKIEINAEDKALEGEAQYNACFDSGCMTVNQTLTFRAPGVFLSKGFWGQSKVPIKKMKDGKKHYKFFQLSLDEKLQLI